VVEKNGAKNWSLTAEDFNIQMGRQAGSGRSGKQCRERWIHHLRPDINKKVNLQLYSVFLSYNLDRRRMLTV